MHTKCSEPESSCPSRLRDFCDIESRRGLPTSHKLNRCLRRSFINRESHIIDGDGAPHLLDSKSDKRIPCSKPSCVLFFILLLSLTAAALWIPFLSNPKSTEGKALSTLPHGLQRFKETVFRTESYQSLPWVELGAQFQLLPVRLSQAVAVRGISGVLCHDEVEEDIQVEDPPPTRTSRWWPWLADGEEPTKRGRSPKPCAGTTKPCFPEAPLPSSAPRQCSVMTEDCAAGDYCAVRNGALGRCPM